MSLTKTRGVVLRAINIKEADRILEIYTDDLGKVRAVAKGVRKIQSRLAGHLEPFTYVDLMFAQGRGDLPTITAARAISHYPGVRHDLKRVAAASYVAELVGRLTPDGQVSRRFPELLRAALKEFNSQSDPSRVASYYEWQALIVSGWEPNLRSCVHCSEHLYPQALSFSISLGGVLCKNCHAHDKEAVQVSPEAVKLLRVYSEQPFRETQGLLVSDKVRKEVKRLVSQVVRYTLEREPRSKAFLAHMETV